MRKLAKYSALNNFKQNYLKTQFIRFCCNKVKYVRRESCSLLYFSKHFVAIASKALSNCTLIINRIKHFLITRRFFDSWMRLTTVWHKCYVVFSRKVFRRLPR